MCRSLRRTLKTKPMKETQLKYYKMLALSILLYNMSFGRLQKVSTTIKSIVNKGIQSAGMRVKQS
jgi:hypothetical protein